MFAVGAVTAGSTSRPGSSSVPTGWARASPARSARRSRRSARPGGATHYAYFAGDWPAMEYHLGDRLLRGSLPHAPWRSLRLGVLSRRRGPAVPPLAPHARLPRSTRWSGSGARVGRPSPDRRTAGRGTRGMIGCRITSADPSAPGGRSSVMPATTVTRSPATASATPSGTPNCWRRNSTVSSPATPTRRARSPDTTPSATRMLREIFEITCELTTVPAGGSVHRVAEAAQPARSTPRPATLAARPLPPVLAAA